ncbi:M23 family metallopeptidase [Terrarubrum flagellatum]|uniref:M23 family metallopeptidase n=1 Tax=Terrirubrum flagellatum TaxID=2895980 RepID=UPI003144EFE3
MSAITTLGRSIPADRTAGKRGQIALSIGHEPALDPTGQPETPERQALSIRWLAGTILTGFGGGSLLVAALLLSIDSASVTPERAERLVQPGASAGPQIGGGQKGDKLVRAVEAKGARQSFKSPMTLKVADREVIKVRNFVRVATNLATVSGTLASDVPPFNAMKLMTQDTASERAPEPPAETGDAEVSFVKTDLTAASLVGAQALSDADVAAQIVEERRAFREGGRQPYLPMPAQTLMMRTLRTGMTTPADATAFLPGPAAAPFSNIEVRVVPENVTNLAKTESEKSEFSTEERINSIRKGETIETVLKNNGASPEEIRLIVAALSKNARSYIVPEGRAVKLLMAPPVGRDGRSQILRVTIADGERIESMAAVNDDYAYVNVAPPEAAAKPAPAKPTDDDDEEDDGTGLRFYNSFYETALRQQIPREIIDELVRVFSNDVDMQKRASGSDSFEAFFTDDDGELDLLFASITVNGETFRYYRYANPEENFSDYYNEQGKSARKFLLRKPISEGVFRSPFGMRFHPILRYSRPHNGVDWANKVGTPILAAGNGTVISAGWSSGYGKHTEIQHANGYVTTYSHQSAFASGIVEGAKVRQGQVIGYLGSTGLSTGPHLHYEVVVNGSYVDPMKIKLPRGRELDGKSLAEFQRHREQVDSLMLKAPGAAPKLAQATR